MKSSNILTASLFCLYLGGCGAGVDSGSGLNSDIQLPATVVGRAITYTVTDSGTAGIPNGYKIEWTFKSAGAISGRNPVSGQIVSPHDYSYVVSGKNGVVTVNYVQGNLTAYEKYTMTGSTLTTGSYTYKGNTGTGEKSASGTYIIN